MSHIIAGHFEQQEQVQHAINHLLDAGFPPDQISSFYVNPPGQHDLYPIGGDRDTSPGAEESSEGVVRGVAVGSVIGAGVGMAGVGVAGPVSPVVGALVGAHLGSLIGGLSEMKERGESEPSSDQNAEPQRKPGLLVAVSTSDAAHQDRAIQVFRTLGADQIEHADGTIAEGNWQDFNPLAPPRLLND